MDIKAEIEKIIAKVTKDGDFKEKFAKNPAEAVRGIVGEDVDSDTLNKIIEAVKGLIGKVDFSKIDFSKLDLNDITGKLGGLTGLLGGKKDEKKDEQ